MGNRGPESGAAALQPPGLRPGEHITAHAASRMNGGPLMAAGVPGMDFAFLAALKPCHPLWSCPSCDAETFSKDLLLTEKRLHGGWRPLSHRECWGGWDHDIWNVRRYILDFAFKNL